MIVYQATKARFLGDTDNRDIEDVIATRYLASTGRSIPGASLSARWPLTQIPERDTDRQHC